ncbi:MAG: hypothetical protein R3Y24_14085 [Eubacteriales bacterium]
MIKISHTTSTANSTQDEYDLIKSYIEDDIFQEHCFRRLFRIIIIDGPKTSGRSALSDSLAKKYETPIITVPSTTTDNDKENNKRVDSMFIAQREFATENYMAYYMMQRSCIESYEELINTMFEEGHVVCDSSSLTFLAYQFVYILDTEIVKEKFIEYLSDSKNESFDYDRDGLNNLAYRFMHNVSNKHLRDKLRSYLLDIGNIRNKYFTKHVPNITQIILQGKFFASDNLKDSFTYGDSILENKLISNFEILSGILDVIEENDPDRVIEYDGLTEENIHKVFYFPISLATKTVVTTVDQYNTLTENLKF